MKESKDPFDRMILDDLEREADEIRRNVAAANLPPMTNEQKERIRENIQKEIDAREVQKICEQLPKEYQEALKIGMETIEKENRKSGKDNETEATKVRVDKETEATKVRADKETEEPKAGADKETEEGETGFGANKETEEGELSAGTDEKKQSSRRKAYLSRVAAAVVIVLLAGGIGVTSFGGPERVMEMMKRNVGSREVEQVDSNKDNLVIKEENEEKAYQKIKDELGIEPVRIIDRPDGFKYKWTKLEKRAQISEIMYQYKEENILYTISMTQSNNSMGIDVDDIEVGKYMEKVNGVNISIHEYKVSKSKEKRYVAKFKYLGVRYYLTGVMPKKDFNNILKKLYFS
ncbi:MULTISPECIES: DUF4367 domain-containing protein [Dorea]|uniref:DUF4367 domain-containing protein n=1 Tax=Dorea hominis TaxID=2763040 RepID=A0ABR7EU72_9FIRM|nr:MULTISPECIES: DUF4367 domain-containing protein [Dorea]MBC5664210.1 DUF4367 domain-containing protein [Dorea hominis]RHO41968.1 DUF4367 domain-containing protein [Dorea sp. AM13-35]